MEMSPYKPLTHLTDALSSEYCVFFCYFRNAYPLFASILFEVDYQEDLIMDFDLLLWPSMVIIFFSLCAQYFRILFRYLMLHYEYMPV